MGRTSFASGLAFALVCAGCFRPREEPLVTPAVASHWENIVMLHPRYHGTAVRLPDGGVLILGGETPNMLKLPESLVTATEIYKPGTKTFVSGPSLPTQSPSPVAAPTSDGVLVSDPFDGGRARVFDPANGSVRAVGAPSAPHSAMVPLLDGTVLVMCGGGRGGETVAELYSPSTQSFTRVGDLLVKRLGCQATLLKDGRVLVTGGTSAEEPTYNKRIADSELYDPATRSFARTGSMRKTRDTHTATLLLDGRVLIAGGIDEEEGITASAEIYDAGTGQFREIAPMRLPRASHGAALLTDGRVLVAGGASAFSGNDFILRSAEVFDPSSERFLEAQPMPSPCQGFTATLLPTGDVLIVGGWDGAFGGTAALFHLEPNGIR